MIWVLVCASEPFLKTITREIWLSAPRTFIDGSLHCLILSMSTILVLNILFTQIYTPNFNVPSISVHENLSYMTGYIMGMEQMGWAWDIGGPSLGPYRLVDVQHLAGSGPNKRKTGQAGQPTSNPFLPLDFGSIHSNVWHEFWHFQLRDHIHSSFLFSN